MSNSDIRVVPGPANYFSHPGSLARLSDFFNADQLSRAVWVYGERALAGAEPFLPAAFHLPEAKKIRFTGHCSERDVAGLVQASGDDRAVVIGVGGGALLDSAKVLARRLGVPLVAIPTIAATCAAWTPLSVWYSDAGQALNFEIFDDANFLVLVEPRIILNAPAEYLLAGIGDTLAKWYEAVVLAPQPEALPLTVRLGINGAQAIRDVLLASSETALADQRRGDLTQAFRDVVEAIIAEVQDADGLNLGIQWANKNAGMTQFTNSGLPISTVIAGANQYNKDGTVSSSLASALGSFNGIAAGFYQGNWAMLLTALSSSTKNDILATPSIVTLDNMQATFNVGQ